jgi:tripartite-type tricarboxylate transporter receptor subunit TctC
MNSKGMIATAVLAIATALPTASLAEWPERPIRMIIPFGPGGGADTLGRTIAEPLAEILGTQIIGENVTGAGGTIGVGTMASSEADDYTIGVVNVSTNVTAPAVRDDLPYDPGTSFEYIAMLGGAPTVIAVNPDTGITSLEELVAAARDADPLMAYGSPGLLTMSNLVPAKYFVDIGVPVEAIPYQGAAEAVVDAVAGHIPFTGTTFSTARPHLDEGTLTALAISTPERVPSYPDVPTFAELGHADLTSITWFGLAAPAGTSPEVVARINEGVNQVLQMPEIVEFLEGQGFVILPMTADEFTSYAAEQLEIWGPIAQSVSE